MCQGSSPHQTHLPDHPQRSMCAAVNTHHSVTGPPKDFEAQARLESGARSRAISRRINAIVALLAAVMLVLLGAGAAVVIVPSLTLALVVDGVRSASLPAVTALASVQDERQLSMSYLEHPGTGTDALRQGRQATDQAVASMRAATAPLLAQAPQPIVDTVHALDTALDRLTQQRHLIDTGGTDTAGVFAYFNGVIDAATSVFVAQSNAPPDAVTVQGAYTSVAAFRLTEQMKRGAALVTAALAAGQMSAQDHDTYAAMVGSYHSTLDFISSSLQPRAQQVYRDLVTSPAWQALTSGEAQLVEYGPWAEHATATTRSAAGVPVSAEDWQQLTQTVAKQLTALTLAEADQVSATSQDAAYSSLWVTSGVSVVVVLVAVGSCVVAWRLARSLTRRFDRVRTGLLERAALQSEIIQRARAGERIDPATELPDLDGTPDELGDLAAAFTAEQRSTLQAVVQQVRRREGSRALVDALSRRTDGLVTRLLNLVAELQQREENSDRLTKLFDIDHLAMLIRRHAQNLGVAVDRPRGPAGIPYLLVQVVRGAITQSRDYQRVEDHGVVRGLDAWVPGHVAVDATHLITELLDNALWFSQAPATVQISIAEVPAGLAVDIADAGLGMAPDDIDRVNALMANPPDFDALLDEESDHRLGLFVASRLAGRHGIDVTFRPSAYRGVQVTVLIPRALLLDTDGQENGKPRDPAPISDTGDGEHRGGNNQRGGLRADEPPAAPAAARPPASVPQPSEESGRHAAPDAHRPAVAFDPPAPAVDGAGVAADVGAQDTPGTRPPLPLRTPQQRLAPGLRDDQSIRGTLDEPDDDGQGPRDEQDPAEIRRLYSSFQHGTATGRAAGAQVNGAQYATGE